jgi:hypothetical protein
MKEMSGRLHYKGAQQGHYLTILTLIMVKLPMKKLIEIKLTIINLTMVSLNIFN